ncbi:MAG: glycosyltransferase family 4 protein [Verrucomicrobia bacterium]|nr:glycosyltransferase family 4 protein [Verrucomicrobiota bacterium]
MGGAETLLRTLAGYAVKSGIEVNFLTTCARNHFTWENELPAGTRTIDGIQVHFFPVDGDRDIERFLRVQEKISRGKKVTPDEEQTWLRNNVNSSALLAHLREAGPRYERIILGPYLFGLTYFAAAVDPRRTVLVPCLHDEAFAYLTAFGDMFRNARTIMFNSAPERDLAARLYASNLATMPVVGMGIPAFTADPKALAQRLGLSSPYVLYAGRREPMKGTPLLLDYLDAFRQRTQRDVKLVLTGSGPFDPPPALAPHITDLGFVDEQTKREAMAGAVAFCHPSVNESFGIVVLEAWMADCPALVHARGEVLRHLCQTSNGGLWFRGYPEFEESLVLLLDQPELRNALGQSGRRHVRKEFTVEAVTQRLLAALSR